MKIITKNAKETKNLGKKFVHKVKPGDTLLLYGDLGAGKTTFVQGFSQGLGIKDRILSPTFVIQRVHQIPGLEIKNLNHIDLYRVEKPTELKNLGLEEIFDENQSITIIEWAERLKGFNPERGYKIYIKYLTDSEREIKIEQL